MSAHIFATNFVWMGNFDRAFNNKYYLEKHLSLKTLCFIYIKKNNIKAKLINHLPVDYKEFEKHYKNLLYSG